MNWNPFKRKPKPPVPFCKDCLWFTQGRDNGNGEFGPPTCSHPLVAKKDLVTGEDDTRYCFILRSGGATKKWPCGESGELFQDKEEALEILGV